MEEFYAQPDVDLLRSRMKEVSAKEKRRYSENSR